MIIYSLLIKVITHINNYFFCNTTSSIEEVKFCDKSYPKSAASTYLFSYWESKILRQVLPQKCKNTPLLPLGKSNFETSLTPKVQQHNISNIEKVKFWDKSYPKNAAIYYFYFWEVILRKSNFETSLRRGQGQGFWGKLGNPRFSPKSKNKTALKS